MDSLASLDKILEFKRLLVEVMLTAVGSSNQREWCDDDKDWLPMLRILRVVLLVLLSSVPSQDKRLLLPLLDPFEPLRPGKS